MKDPEKIAGEVERAGSPRETSEKRRERRLLRNEASAGLVHRFEDVCGELVPTSWATVRKTRFSTS